MKDGWNEDQVEVKKKRKGTPVWKVAVSIFIICILVAVGVMAFVEKIERGTVASVYSVQGGTSDEVLSEGWHIVSPMKRLTNYPISIEQVNLKLYAEEEMPNGNFDAICSDGVLNVDFEMSYQYDVTKIPEIAKQYRGLSGEDIMISRIAPKIPTYVTEVTSQYTIMEAYQDKKPELNAEITAHLKEKLNDYGIIVRSATLPKARPADSIKAAIEERSKIAQEMQAKLQEQEKVKIEAENKVIVAEGEANARIETARGVAEANKLMEQTLSPLIIQKMYMDKWDGKLPMVSGDSNAIVDARDMMKPSN